METKVEWWFRGTGERGNGISVKKLQSFSLGRGKSSGDGGWWMYIVNVHNTTKKKISAQQKSQNCMHITLKKKKKGSWKHLNYPSKTYYAAITKEECLQDTLLNEKGKF